MKRLVTEKGMFVPAPYERILQEKHATLLEPLMYAVVKDHLTGQTRNEVGPQLLQVGPYEELMNVSTKWVLEKDSYLRLVNKQTGEERVMQGPSVVVPTPVETAPDGKQKAVYIDSQTAVKVLNRRNGQQRLDDTTGVFVPQPYERILETQRKILVLPHQAVVLRDIYGTVSLITGASGGGANTFFMPPVQITMIDLRAQKMFFQNEVRTSDNVRLKLEATYSSQASDTFYSDRGVELQSLEITRFDSVDSETALVLQNIIKETTMRINELQKQESQNAVNAAKLTADIKLEQQRTELIQTQADNERLQKQFQGQSDGQNQVQAALAYISGLSSSVPNVTERVEMYRLQQTLKARQADTSSLAKGKAQIFMTPQDFNLSLGSESV
eukprot:g32271.t1